MHLAPCVTPYHTSPGSDGVVKMSGTSRRAGRCSAGCQPLMMGDRLPFIGDRENPCLLPSRGRGDRGGRSIPCLSPAQPASPPSRRCRGLDPGAMLSAGAESMSSEDRHLRRLSRPMRAGLSRTVFTSREGDRTSPLEVGDEAGCMRGVRGLSQSSSSASVFSVQHTAQASVGKQGALALWLPIREMAASPVSNGNPAGTSGLVAYFAASQGWAESPSQDRLPAISPDCRVVQHSAARSHGCGTSSWVVTGH